MKIEYYTKNKEAEIFEVLHIPDYNPLSLTVTYSNPNNSINNNNDFLGSIEIRWYNEDKSSENVYININETTYMIVNDKDKFILKNKTDLFELYKYFTNTDTDLFLKQFKTLDKVHSLERDFK